MTADIEMLPLPDEVMHEMENMVSIARAAGFTVRAFYHAIRDYARAVAEYNVAPRDAEIEALRAEVDMLRGKVDEAVVELLCRKARAERLAEALRKIAALTEEFDDLDDATGIANEALEQGAGRG